jgi:hypothetical protein
VFFKYQFDVLFQARDAWFQSVLNSIPTDDRKFLNKPVNGGKVMKRSV